MYNSLFKNSNEVPSAYATLLRWKKGSVFTFSSSASFSKQSSQHNTTCLWAGWSGPHTRNGTTPLYTKESQDEFWVLRRRECTYVRIIAANHLPEGHSITKTIGGFVGINRHINVNIKYSRIWRKNFVCLSASGCFGLLGFANFCCRIFAVIVSTHRRSLLPSAIYQRVRHAGESKIVAIVPWSNSASNFFRSESNLLICLSTFKGIESEDTAKLTTHTNS